MRMQTIILIAALALSPALEAAKAKVAPTAEPTAAASAEAEPMAPELKSSDAPEMADPDLKDATPVMRQGTEEPLGGFHERGMADRTALTLGVVGTGASSLKSLGANYWFNDRWAVVSRFGMNYQDQGNSSYVTKVSALLGLRRSLKSFGPGMVFAQLGGGFDLTHLYSVAVLPVSGYTQYLEQTSNSGAWHLGLGLGAEVFWPGSRNFSFEILGNLKAYWISHWYAYNDYSSDQVSGSNGVTQSTAPLLFQLGWENSDVLSSFNIYF
jgi:hypothetical protein